MSEPKISVYVAKVVANPTFDCKLHIYYLLYIIIYFKYIFLDKSSSSKGGKNLLHVVYLHVLVRLY